jgi:peptide/nickel transport system substrate-binding protein
MVTDKSGKPLDKNPLKDVRVRRAPKAINRQAIVERAWRAPWSQPAS